MKTAVFSFIKASPNSMIASARIARFVAQTLDVPCIDDETIHARWDVLILVNGAFSFCNVRDDVAYAVRHAARIVWIQNDYAIYAPVHDSKGETPFRKAFKLREDRDLPRMDMWTTVKERVAQTPASRYINWNTLTARPRPLPFAEQPTQDLFYYGSWRMYREQSFARFFDGQRMPVVVSSPSEKFEQAFPVRVIGAIPKERFYTELNGHGFGLYIEDARSHKQFHSPANRFYEMLSAGLPMVFEPESRTMLRQAGFDPKDFLVRNQRDVHALRYERDAIAAEQRNRWWTSFRADLKHTVRSTYRQYIREYF